MNEDAPLPPADPHAEQNTVDKSVPRETVLLIKKALLHHELQHKKKDLAGWLELLKQPKYAALVTSFGFDQDDGTEIRYQNYGSWTLHKYPSEAQALQRSLEEKGLTNFSLVGTGDKCLVLGCLAKFKSEPNVRPVAIRIRHQGSETTPRVKIPTVLQAYADEHSGDLMYYEGLPLLRTNGVPKKNMQALDQATHKVGYEWRDNYDYNTGYLTDDTSVIVDGGKIVVNGLIPKYAHLDFNECLKPWMDEKGEWTQHKLYPGLNQGWEQIEGQITGHHAAHHRHHRHTSDRTR